jgi:hypothetical protein
LTRRGISPQLAAMTESTPTPMAKAPRPPIAIAFKKKIF